MKGIEKSLKKQLVKEYKKVVQKGEAELVRAMKKYTKDYEEGATESQEPEPQSVNESTNSDTTLLVRTDDPINSDPTAYTFDNYTKGTFLGKGSYGTVYKCVNKHDGREIAVKEMPICVGSSYQKQIKAFENEIEIYKRLSLQHPRVIQYFDTRCELDTMYLFMEYVEGGSIAKYLDEHGSLSPPSIARITKQILDGLQYLHSARIIHRDIKGGNILKDHDDNVKICDFGISRYLQTISSNNQGSSYSGTEGGLEKVQTICGSPYWMAPEVINEERYGTLADVWSLGATVVEMLTADHPYPGVGALRAMFLISTTKRLEYDCPGDIPDELRAFIDSMLVADPRNRATVEALLQSDFILSVP